MSADNGIYILKTKDQYRVAHLQAIENVSWSYIDGDWQNKDSARGKFVPTRVVEMWGDCRFTRNESVAQKIASEWAFRLPFCEYGVRTIIFPKTWKHILIDAKKYAKQELEFCETSNSFIRDKDKLERIANGEYLTDWLNRKSYYRDLHKYDCGYWSVCTDHGCKCAIDSIINGFNSVTYENLRKDKIQQGRDMSYEA